MIEVKMPARPKTAKPSAVRSQRLCLRPPYVPFSWTVIVGMSKLGWAVIPFSAAVEDAQSDRGRIALARFRSSAKVRQRCAKRVKAWLGYAGAMRPAIAAQINMGGTQRSVLRIACEHHASSIAATTSAVAARSRLSGLRLM